jgi:hypothetical protein
MYNRNSISAKKGEWAQVVADKKLLIEGFLILDAHRCGNNGAALLRGRDGCLIAMDNVDMKDGKTILRDTKYKTQSTFTRFAHKEQHGIDAVNFDHYKEQCKKSGLEGHIAVVELYRETEPYGKLKPSGKLLIYDLDSCVRRVGPDVASYGKGGMVYWNREDFIEEYDLGLEIT